MSAEKLLPNKFTLSFRVKLSKNRHLITTQNINAPIGGTYDPLNGNLGVFPGGTQEQILKYQSIGRQNAALFTTSLTFPQWKLFGQKFYASASYTFQRSKSDIVAGSGSPFDPYNFDQEYSSDSNDGVHYFHALVSLNLPLNFQVNGMWLAQTGERFNIITGIDTNGDGFYLERPSFARDNSAAGVIETKYGLLNPNPSPGDVIIPRNLGRGPFKSSLDIFLTKWLLFNKDKTNNNQAKHSLRLFVDAYNILNYNNRSSPISNISSPNFLRYVELNNPNAFSYGARKFRFGVGFYF